MNRNKHLSEFVGALLGDGFLSRASGSYQIGFVGHPKDDREYFVYLASLVQKLWGVNPSVVYRARGLRFNFYSKKAFQELLNKFDLHVGKGKSLVARIPDMLKSEKLRSFVIRGLADTDGSFFTSKKPGVEKYPSIEFTTISIQMANDIRDILIAEGFRVPKIRSYLSGSRKTFKVSIYGFVNMKKWLVLGGFSNPVKQRKIEKYGTAGM